jgi:putative colanic acid biosynthesis glycosyltransferase
MNNSLRKSISVVTIVRNDVAHIKSTIESVIRIKNQFIEYVVVDGKSTDGTLEILSNYKDKIDVFVSEKDSGIYNAMNKGLTLATGESIIFMNSGDTFHAEFAFEQILDLKNLDSKVVIGRSIQYFKNDCYLRTSNERIDLLIANPPHQSVFVPKSFYKFHPYDESLEIASDYYWIKKAMNNCGFEIIESIISEFSLGGRSSSNSLKDIFQVQKEMKSDFAHLKAMVKFIVMNMFGMKYGYRLLFFAKYKRVNCEK